MLQCGDHANRMQPNCSYNAARIELTQQSICCWEATHRFQGCTRVRTQHSHGGLYWVSRCWRSFVIAIIILTGMMHPSVAFTVTDDVQDRALEDNSMLARAGNLITEAVFDAANPIQTSKRRRAVEQRTLRLADKDVRQPSPANLHDSSVTLVPPFLPNPCQCTVCLCAPR